MGAADGKIDSVDLQGMASADRYGGYPKKVDVADPRIWEIIKAAYDKLYGEGSGSYAFLREIYGWNGVDSPDSAFVEAGILNRDGQLAVPTSGAVMLRAVCDAKEVFRKALLASELRGDAEASDFIGKVWTEVAAATSQIQALLRSDVGKLIIASQRDGGSSPREGSKALGKEVRIGDRVRGNLYVLKRPNYAAGPGYMDSQVAFRSEEDCHFVSPIDSRELLVLKGRYLKVVNDGDLADGFNFEYSVCPCEAVVYGFSYNRRRDRDGDDVSVLVRIEPKDVGARTGSKDWPKAAIGLHSVRQGVDAYTEVIEIKDGDVFEGELCLHGSSSRGKRFSFDPKCGKNALCVFADRKSWIVRFPVELDFDGSLLDAGVANRVRRYERVPCKARMQVANEGGRLSCKAHVTEYLG
jgi:hypothetical protein